MASLSTDKRGNRTIQFKAGDRRRRTIRLGRRSLLDAETIKTKVEDLCFAAVAGVSPKPQTAAWVSALDFILYDKLAGVGLLPKRIDPGPATLAAFLDAHIGSRTHVKPSTHEKDLHAREKLVASFGADRLLSDVTKGDADAFRLHLRNSLAENTVRGICRKAKQFFRAAERKRLIVESPFADMKRTSDHANKLREFFVTRKMADQVLEACPDTQWKLVFALARFGGLRCVSELYPLTWGDVDWDRGRLTVHSPKTEHHEGRECRVIPLFPELRPHVEAAFEEAAEGSAYMVTRYRQGNRNLATQLRRIIRAAGLAPWPKLFMNLRASRETELAERFPMHVVCAWMGNSKTVAMKHYLQVTDDHFAVAQKNAPNALQYPPVPSRDEPSAETPMQEIPEEYDVARDYTDSKAPPVGLEPTT